MRSLVSVGLLLLAAGACGSPASRFYMLSDRAFPAATAPAAGFPSTIVVNAASVPDSVDRPQLVVMNEAELVVLEQERWAEPLRAGVARLVAAHLGRLLGTSRVSSSDDVLRQPDYRIVLDVRRFDAMPDKEVDIEVLWRMVPPNGDAVVGHKRVREPIKGGGYENVVAADARALEAISREIAAMVAAAGNGVSGPAAAARGAGAVAPPQQ